MIIIPIFVAITILGAVYGEPQTPIDPHVRMSEMQRGMMK